MSRLTVIIPTFNEEHYIEGALYSVKFADQIIVVDSFSTDKTAAIAKAHNCQVIERQFDNFSNQKNHALSYATSEWVLFLDADERITHALQKEMENVMATGKHTAYKLHFPHFFMNRFMYHHHNDVTRLVKRDKCHFEGNVHEKLIVDGTTGKLKNKVLHYTYKGLEHNLKKKDHYAWFQAEQMQAKNKRTNYFLLVFKPSYRFFHEYIVKGGFLDGIPGLAVAGINAYGVFSRYAKLMLLQRGLK
ncbi:MAG TPA: glycosyltransferase family 2 protein [Aquaticitalea sp.]|nr:glycosyltransferase family 2 protein [Aquaticitalea sp.]HNU59375.1 glycosyltransferase family 2 protein [Aquaticitalea sp.]